MSGVFDTAYSLLRVTESGKPRGSLSGPIGAFDATICLLAYYDTKRRISPRAVISRER